MARLLRVLTEELTVMSDFPFEEATKTEDWQQISVIEKGSVLFAVVAGSGDRKQLNALKWRELQKVKTKTDLKKYSPSGNKTVTLRFAPLKDSGFGEGVYGTCTPPKLVWLQGGYSQQQF